MKQKVKTKLPKSYKSKRKEIKIYNNVVFHKLDWLEWTAIIIGLIFLLFPTIIGYKLLFTILVSMPILGIFLNGFHQPSIASLVEIDLIKDKYDVADFIDWPAWIIAIRIMLDFNIKDLGYLIIPGLIGFIAIIILLFLTHKIIKGLHKSKEWVYLSIIFNLLIYSYASIYGINCVYDKSVPTRYSSVIAEKYTTSRKGSKKYYLKYYSLENSTATKDLQVSIPIYERTQIGDFIDIAEKEGVFGIPWWYMEGVRENPEQ